jgi:hypothetical protein
MIVIVAAYIRGCNDAMIVKSLTKDFATTKV